MTIKKIVREVSEGKKKALDRLMDYSEKITREDKKDLNIFLHLNETAIEEAKKLDKRIKDGEEVGKLAGTFFALKSNIAYKGMTTNCASRILEGYVSAYNSTIVNKLLSEDAILIGMVNMDEFACGASGEKSAFGPTKNPKDPELITGGSSSGSAAAVAAGLCDFAIGSDTGGSIRNPASHCGIVGFKPTYGAVSRYGLIDLSMSFDCIGPLTKTSEDAKMVFETISGQDHFDTTTKEESYNEKRKNKIAVVNVEGFADKRIKAKIDEKIEETAKKQGWTTEEIFLPLSIALETYYILVFVEFFSGTRKFDGRRFGLNIDKHSGEEVQRRIIGGREITKAEFAGKYYREALKARNFIKKEFEKIFKKYDAILMPTVPKLPHKIGEKITPIEMYAYDVFTVLANIAQIPAISIPAGEIDNKPTGMQILTPWFDEELIFKLSKDFE